MTQPTSPARPGRINFNSVGELLPDSIYTAKLTGKKWSAATDQRGEMWTLIFQITNNEKYGGKKIFRNFMTEGDAAFYFMEALVALGIDPDELFTNEVEIDEETGEERPKGVDIEPLIDSAMQANVRLTINHRSYADKKQPMLPDGSYPLREVNNVEKIEAI